MRLLWGGGGAWKGMFSVPIATHLWEQSLLEEDPYDAAGGTSVSAINMSMVVQEKFDALRGFWGELDTKNPIPGGIPGFIRCRIREIVLFYLTLSWVRDTFVWLRWFPKLVDMPDSLFDNAPVRKKLMKNVDPKEFRIPLAVGIVNWTTGAHETQIIDSATPRSLAVDWIVASTAMAGIFNPTVQGGQEKYDGGHHHVMPPVPEQWLPSDLTELSVDFIMHQVVGDYPGQAGSIAVPDFLERFLWVLEQALHVAVMEDYEDMRELASAGARVRGWSPPFHLGGMLDASKDTLTMREEAGLDSLEKYETL